MSAVLPLPLTLPVLIHPSPSPPSPHSPTSSEASLATPSTLREPSLPRFLAPSLLPPVDSHFLPSPRVNSQHGRRNSALTIAHPYARLYAKKGDSAGKRRKIWHHSLEKLVFSAQEIASMGAPHRRTIYMASLEAHIDALHAQLIENHLYPVAFSSLEPFRGLNCKTAKSMVAGLQHDAAQIKIKLLELERANHGLRNVLARRKEAEASASYQPPGLHLQPVRRRHSVDIGRHPY